MRNFLAGVILIYSKAFDSLPPPVKDRGYRRLWEVLSERDLSAAFARRTSAERKAILEVSATPSRAFPTTGRLRRKYSPSEKPVVIAQQVRRICALTAATEPAAGHCQDSQTSTSAME